MLRGAASAFLSRAAGSDLVIRGVRDGTVGLPPGETPEDVIREAQRAARADRRRAKELLKHAARISKTLGLLGETA